MLPVVSAVEMTTEVLKSNGKQQLFKATRLHGLSLMAMQSVLRFVAQRQQEKLELDIELLTNRA